MKYYCNDVLYNHKHPIKEKFCDSIDYRKKSLNFNKVTFYAESSMILQFWLFHLVFKLKKKQIYLIMLTYS